MLFEQIKLVRDGIVAVISVYSFVFVIKFEPRDRVESMCIAQETFYTRRREMETNNKSCHMLFA